MMTRFFDPRDKITQERSPIFHFFFLATNEPLKFNENRDETSFGPWQLDDRWNERLKTSDNGKKIYAVEVGVVCMSLLVSVGVLDLGRI